MSSSSDTKCLQAVVIGSGFAGLSAAAGLSKVFDSVILLDKDDFKLGLSRDEVADPHMWHEEYEAEIKRRQGVSQYRQPHVMLVKGLQELEALFPGYTSQLLAAGAVPVDVVGNWSLHDWGQHWNRPDHDSGQKSVCASRHLYENIARGFVLKISNVAVKTAAAVKTLKFDAATARVTGVVLKNGDSIAADLVVDASGGNSRVNKWLQDIGHPVPPPYVVDAGLQYTCRMYERTGSSDRDTDMVMVMDAPQYNVMGVRLPIEHGKWQVVLVGYKGYHCPSDEAGFLEFARNLPSPEIYNSIKDAKPASPISPYTQTANIRRKFESVPPPSGLCVIGDACCRFNPAFGQGMSVSVMGSALLCKCVKESLASAGPSKQQKLAALQSLPANFHSQLNNILEFPWTTSSGADAMKPDAKVEGAPEQKFNPFASLLARYFALLGRARFKDAYVFEKMSAVQNMIASPDTLFKPDVIGRALVYWLRGILHL